MAIKLELYKIFKTVCDCKSFSDAAKLLFISQSAVSQSIKQMESQTGVSLFRRNANGIIMTSEGQLLYEYAASAIALLDTAEQKLDAMKNMDIGDLKIGASDTISRYLLLPVLEQYSYRYPKIKLQIVNRTTPEAIALLKNGKIDLAFVNMPCGDDEIHVDSFFAVHDIFVAGKQAGKNYFDHSLSLAELSQLPLILLEKKANSRRFVETFFNENGVNLIPEIELGSHDLLLEFAKINLGVSCVIKEFSAHYLNQLEVRELALSNPIPQRSIGVARLKGVSLSTASTKFLELL